MTLLEQLNIFVGLTIAKVEFNDKDDFEDGHGWPGQGITITFTNGSTLKVDEGSQSGEIDYYIDHSGQEG